MCGIAGVVGRASKEELADSVKGMVLAMRRRGPDGMGSWVGENVALGHCRLSIIDVSSAADQPMLDADTGVAIVFNGEIYNYLELRRELTSYGHSFLTRSDTEVLLRAFLHWGAGAFSRCVGMWAVAIYDPRSRELVLSRDRFGIKPMFLHQAPDGGTVFGSTPEVVFASELVARQVDADTVRNFLVNRSVDEGTASFFAGVEHFPAATYATLDLGDPGFPIRFKSYWDPAEWIEADPKPLRFPDAVREFRSLLRESVAIHTRSDVEVSACLSGGLDSSVLVAMLATIPEGRDIRKVFSAVFPGLPYDEDRYSDSVAMMHGLYRHRVQPDAAGFLSDIGKVACAQEEPFGSTGVYVQWKVFQAIHSEGIKVAIDGQGADEYLAGYFSFLVPFALEALSSGKVIRALKAWRAYRRGNLFSHNILHNLPALRARLLGESLGRSASPNERLLSPALQAAEPGPTLMPEVKAPCGSGLKRALVRYLVRHSLPALLRYEDRNSMYFSVESRVPYLDHRLVEFALSLPTEHLIDGSATKRVLRAGVRDIVPALVHGRIDKIGFGNPESAWIEALVKSGAYHDALGQRAASDIVDVGRVRQVLESGGTLRTDSNLLWRIFNVLQWHALAFR